jgi:hypothetical protein
MRTGPLLTAVLAACVVVASCSPVQAAAQVHGTITADPLGFLCLGPALNIEFALGQRIGVVAGVRDMAGGWIAVYASEEEGYKLKQGLMWGGAVRCYFGAAGRLQGWYCGPRAEFGEVIAAGAADAWAVLMQVECGYTWVTASRWVYGLGGQVGAGVGWNQGTRLGSSESDEEWYPVGNVLAYGGYAF